MLCRSIAVAFLLVGLAAPQAWSAPGLKADFIAALTGFQSFSVASKTGVAIGDATAAGKTFPLATLRVSGVNGSKKPRRRPANRFRRRSKTI